MAAVVIPNLVAIAVPFESWPYTNAPMFAHRVAPDTQRYAFVFEGRRDDGGVVELGFYSAGARWSLMRYFFKFVYGAAPAGGEFCVYPDDDRAALEKRLGEFFTVFAERYRDREPAGAHLARIVLRLARLEGADNDRVESWRVGVFDVATGTYRHDRPGPR